MLFSLQAKEVSMHFGQASLHRSLMNTAYFTGASAFGQCVLGKMLFSFLIFQNLFFFFVYGPHTPSIDPHHESLGNQCGSTVQPHLGPSLWGPQMLCNGFEKIKKVVKKLLKSITFSPKIPNMYLPRYHVGASIETRVSIYVISLGWTERDTAFRFNILEISLLELHTYILHTCTCVNFLNRPQTFSFTFVLNYPLQIYLCLGMTKLALAHTLQYLWNAHNFNINHLFDEKRAC